jgi:hypothetical protein
MEYFRGTYAELKKLVNPTLNRRQFLQAGVSASLLAAIAATEAVASPLWRPKPPEEDKPISPDINSSFPTIGTINLNHQFTTHTGNLRWDINNGELMTIVEELDSIGGGADITSFDNDNRDFSAAFAVLVFAGKISRIHFPVITNDFSIEANTINMTPDQAAQLARIEASWTQGRPIKSETFAADNSNLPLIGRFRRAQH